MSPIPKVHQFAAEMPKVRPLPPTRRRGGGVCMHGAQPAAIASVQWWDDGVREVQKSILFSGMRAHFCRQLHTWPGFIGSTAAANT